VGKMSRRDWDRIGKAIMVWTGWGRSEWPRRDKSVLVDHFGEDAAVELLPLVRELEEDFYSSDARHVALDLAEMAEMASAQFRERHPEIADAAVQALAWCYTYDYK
jgi:hypothetical protein